MLLQKLFCEMQQKGLVIRLERSRTSHSEVNPTDGSTAGCAFSCLEVDSANGHESTHANHIAQHKWLAGGLYASAIKYCGIKRRVSGREVYDYEQPRRVHTVSRELPIRVVGW